MPSLQLIHPQTKQREIQAYIHLKQMPDGKIAVLVYDKNGNLVSGNGKYREFNEFNQLVRIRNGNTAGSAILTSGSP